MYVLWGNECILHVLYRVIGIYLAPEIIIGEDVKL